MSVPATLQRLDNSTRRADSLLAEIERRERDREAREIAERDRADAAEARADSERCRQVQVKYADAFSAFGVQTPAPVEGERPGRYRQRLYEYLRKKLPSNHDLFSVRADDIPAGQAATNFETMMIAAAMAEGLRPSAENLPASGELVRRDTVDQMTARRQSTGSVGKFFKTNGQSVEAARREIYRPQKWQRGALGRTLLSH